MSFYDTILGNHDAYSKRSQHHFFNYFPQNQHLNLYTPLQHIKVITLNPCLPNNSIHCQGYYPTTQLDQLQQLLNDDAVCRNQLIVLATHYPLFINNGNYEQQFPWSGVRNGSALVDILQQSQYTPSLILHGHVHIEMKHYVRLLQNQFVFDDHYNPTLNVPVMNPGSASIFTTEHHQRHTPSYHSHLIETDDNNDIVSYSIHRYSYPFDDKYTVVMNYPQSNEDSY